MAERIIRVPGNHLYYGDNLDVLRAHVETESVDLIYLDPPFNSNRSYNVLFQSKEGTEDQAQMQAFDDTWTWTPDTEAHYQQFIYGGLPPAVATALRSLRQMLSTSDVFAYLTMMAPRLAELHRVLKKSGTLYLHCDPKTSHYLKVLLDAVFGPEKMRNEIIWNYGGRGAKAVAYQFPRNHDVLLMYSKVDGQQHFEHQFVDRVMSTQEARKRGYRQDEQNRWFKTAPRGDYTDESIDRLDVEGRIHWTRNGNPRVKYFLDVDQDGNIVEKVRVGDVWSDIPDAMHMSKAERLGYETQKPEALLERIIRASSEENAVVLDPFCGCGTTVAVAHRLRRSWIGIDITFIAVDLIRRRLEARYGERVTETYETHGIPRDLEGARALNERSPFDFERWAVHLVHGTPNQRQVGDRGVDGVVLFDVGYNDRSGKALVSVKGGRQLGPSMVRELVGTVETEQAEMGILVTLEEPTRGMIDAANQAGSFQVPLYARSYPKIQIIQVRNLLGGKRPDMPPPYIPYMQATRAPVGEQGVLDI
jgi:DNA modification methylase